jgi:hypothetical protein
MKMLKSTTGVFPLIPIAVVALLILGYVLFAWISKLSVVNSVGLTILVMSLLITFKSPGTLKVTVWFFIVGVIMFLWKNVWIFGT